MGDLLIAVGLVACVAWRARIDSRGGTLVRQTLGRASPLAYFRRSPTLRWGGAAGIRTPDLLIAKACPAPMVAVACVAWVASRPPGCPGVIPRGAPGGHAIWLRVEVSMTPRTRPSRRPGPDFERCRQPQRRRTGSREPQRTGAPPTGLTDTNGHAVPRRQRPLLAESRMFGDTRRNVPSRP